MSREIAVRQHQPMGLEITNFHDAEQMAARFAQSSLIPSDLRGKPADVMVILVTGHELGLSPMQSLRGLHVVKGRPVLAAEMIVALIKRSPLCKHFRLVESTDQSATYEAMREGDPEPTRLTYTIEQAQKAGLTGNPNYKNHPAAMLRARASAALGRIVFPDVMLGLLEESEAEEVRALDGAHQVEGNTKPPPPPQRQEEPAVDAEIVDPAESFAAAHEPEEDPVAEWTERIQGAQTVRELQAVGRELAAAHPDVKSPVRQAVRKIYGDRSTELRRGAA